MASLLAKQIAPFLAMEFSKHAALLEGQGQKIIKLSVGEPDFGALPAVRKAMCDVMDGRSLTYTSALGLPELRRLIAEFYLHAHGVKLDPSRVVVTAGASAALLLVTAALVDRGDEVIMSDPSYPCNRQFLSSFGANVQLIATDASTRFQLTTSAIRERWTENTKGLMIATPSNPVGTSVPVNELKDMCTWARDHGAWRVVDEIYLGLSDGENGGRPVSALNVDDGAIVINSFSKYFGMTGWRLGWCIVPLELVPVMERLAQNFYICPSTPVQYAALSCFTPESISICESRRQELRHRRELALQGLESIGLSIPVKPDGAFYVYIDVSVTGLTAMEFCKRALAEAGVAVTPGGDFGQFDADRYVRLSYAVAESDLREGIKRLGKFMKLLQP